MDQTDEFEMKPLTPGLGFHKRQVSLKEHIAKTGLAGQNLRRSIPTAPPEEMLTNPAQRTSKEIIAELHEALKPIKKKNDSEALKLTETLPREISDVRSPHRPELTPLDNVDFQIPDKSMSDQVGSRRGASDNLVRPLTPVSVSFASIILDGAIVLAFSLIFLVSLIAVTGVDLLSVVKSSQSEFATQLSLGVLYLAVFEMYIIVSRSFFGRSIGEWTFDLQLGKDEQLTLARYPAQVLWRSILNLL
ncbi:MAG: hypothetical protein KDD38_03220, partial [Bdellovibrionales bacterium]|nr:hypothetical protein [Bdellovibrionales bacterium]